MSTPVYVLVMLQAWLCMHLGLFQPEQATLVIYRQSDFQSASFILKVNGEKISENFRAKSVLTVQVPLGNTLIETNGGVFVERKTFSLTAKEGEVYYLEAIVEYSFLSNALYLVRREEAVAQKAINRLTPGKKEP